MSGITVDKNIELLEGSQKEYYTKGLDTIAKMCEEFYKLGCRFAKWRAVFVIEVGK